MNFRIGKNRRADHRNGWWLAFCSGAAAAALLLSALPAAAQGTAQKAARNSRAAIQEPEPAAARGLPDDRLAPLSLAMLAKGNGLLAARDGKGASGYFESALAADPRNRGAYIGLAQAAELEGLPGLAIRYYREALALDPNDRQALLLQGIAMAGRGASARAEENLTRLKALCQGPCQEADRLAAAIASVPAPAAATPASTGNAEGQPGAGKQEGDPE